MDGLIIISLCVVMALTHLPSEAEVQEAKVIEAQQAVQTVVQLNPYLNPTMYHDEQAFMLIANELGFH